MRLERLRQMSLGELALRGRQEASKWLDRVGPAPRPPRAAPAAPAPASLLAPEAGIAALVAARWPETAAALVAAADRVLAGRFDLLGYRDLSFGDPIDWHFEPVAGRRLPRVHWSRIDPLDAAQVGDSKVVWELGRMQWLVTLGQAYRLTGDARYAAGAAAAVRGFLQANPTGVGIHWSSSLECALRIISWSWAYSLFGAEALGREVVDAMMGSIAVQARHVERYLSFAYSPNTHLTGEALGLLYAGLLQPRLPRAARWRLQGLDILRTQYQRQVLEDGIYFEQAAAYQRYTADMGLHLLTLARAGGFQIPDEFSARLCRLLDALLWLRQPDGSLPPIGDADGGWLLPLSPRDPADLRGTFGVAAALLGRPEYAWAAGGTVPEVAWLLGQRGVAASDGLAAAPPADPPSRAFHEGGYVVMASGWEPEAHQLVLD
ncbi:MAG TPA: heparinase II/III family protein, partial [Vicinamibacteria bacterium]